MSGLSDVPLDEQILFLKSVVIPSFGLKKNYVGTREEWMLNKADKFLHKDKVTELMDRFNTVSTLEKAENKLTEAEQGKLQGLTTVAGKLRDGIPLLRQQFTTSPPSVPTEEEHAPCHPIEMDFPYLYTVPEEILNACNTVWRNAGTGGERYLNYGSEEDIVHIIRNYLEDIVSALQLPLYFTAEITIKQIRSDVCVILQNLYLVGVVEVKKPGNNVLLEHTVLGELLDQMLLVEGFYGMGPVIGILTTAEEWRLSWFPVDSDILAYCGSSDASYTIPTKQNTSSKSTERKDHSPFSGTPSQLSGTIHYIDEVMDNFIDSDYDGVTQEMDRSLCVTPVMNIHQNPIHVLQRVCGALHLMSQAYMHHSANLPRFLLKFHKGIHKVTFYPESYDKVYSTVDFNKFPNKTVSTLVALEDLGRGSTGKAWLCVTDTRPCRASCVLKFDNRHSRSEKLLKEKEMWHVLYPEFANMVDVQYWSGADALIMPHFSTILESEREMYKHNIQEVLTTRFMQCNKVHLDIRWQNIGKYMSKSGVITIVVFDLHSVVDYNVKAHDNWIEDAMLSLFENR